LKTIQILDKTFELLISSERIQQAVDIMAFRINQDFAGREPLFLSLLNGSFMFTADLMKRITLNSKITFVKLASYKGDKSAGKIKQLIGLNESLEGKTVIVLEDIIDTGATMAHLTEELKNHHLLELKICSMFLKPEVCEKNLKVDYLGLELPNDFVVGYGLDYNGYGRNYPDLYSLLKK